MNSSTLNSDETLNRKIFKEEQTLTNTKVLALIYSTTGHTSVDAEYKLHDGGLSLRKTSH